jgi:hypothetical protein
MFYEQMPSVTPNDIAVAMLSAARKLGLEGTFLRMAAAELPIEAWSPVIALADDNAVVATAAHQCFAGCLATSGQCLTALKIEEVVSEKMERPYVTEFVHVEGTSVSVRLVPFL